MNHQQPTIDESIERKVEYVAEVCDSVQFLKGVPVSLPSETKALLRGRIRQALTSAKEEGRGEREKEIIEKLNGHIFSRIDFAQYHGKHNQPSVKERESFAKEETEKILQALTKQ